jgi:hypothetical protein
MRQTNRKLTIWLLRLPLWRYLLIYFVVWLAISYICSSAAAWTTEVDGTSGPKVGNSLTYHLVWAVTLTSVSWYGRRMWRRRLAHLLPDPRLAESKSKPPA